jgi:hypothetical protein
VAAGALVDVLADSAIVRDLNTNGRRTGFSDDMVPYCGRSGQVLEVDRVSGWVP